MISFLDAAILGLVQGLAEFLPISSTGHLILASKILGLSTSDFLSSFIIAIQVGSILAVLFLYGRDLFNLELTKKVLAAFIPTAVIGFILYKIIKHFFLTSDLVVAAALIVGGLVMIGLELRHRKKVVEGRGLNDLSYREAVLVGLAQSLAMIPGISRSAATIFGGLSLGLSRSAIVEFSFLLAIPTMIAATGYDLFKSGASFSGGQFEVMAVGTVVSFLVSIVAIRWLLNFIRQHDFIGFGIYRVVVGLLWLIFFIKL